MDHFFKVILYNDDEILHCSTPLLFVFSLCWMNWFIPSFYSKITQAEAVFLKCQSANHILCVFFFGRGALFSGFFFLGDKLNCSIYTLGNTRILERMRGSWKFVKWPYQLNYNGHSGLRERSLLKWHMHLALRFERPLSSWLYQSVMRGWLVIMLMDDYLTPLISFNHHCPLITLVLSFVLQGLKLLGFRMSRTPKNGDGNREMSGQQTALNLGCLRGNPEIAGEIQLLRQVFRTETQILTEISSPVPCVTCCYTHGGLALLVTGGVSWSMGSVCMLAACFLLIIPSVESTCQQNSSQRVN